MNNNDFFLPIETKLRKQKETERVDKVINQIKIGFNDLKTVVSNDSKEQLFIDLFKDLALHVYRDEHINVVIFRDKNDKIFADYNIMADCFWCSYKHIAFLFYKNFKMAYDEVRPFITNQVKKYFKLKNVEKSHFFD